MMTSDGNQDRRTGQPIIPRGEFPCVWMTAGVLTFRLCDRNLDCATCPLESALRNSPGLSAKTPEATRQKTTSGGCLVPEGLFFHPGHTWVRFCRGGEFAVGLDDFGGRVAGQVDRVRLPAGGEYIRAGETAFAIETRGGTLELTAPFSGEVNLRNQALADDPELLRRAPYGAGFLFRATPTDPARALAGLMPGAAALEWTEEQERFLRALVDVATVRAGAAPTLNDGGLLSDDLLAGVTPVKAERIRNWIFNAPFTGREATEK